MITALKSSTAARLTGRSDFTELMVSAGKRPLGARVAFRGRPCARWDLVDIQQVFGRAFSEDEISVAEEPDRRRQRNVARYQEKKRLEALPARREKFRFRGMDYQECMAALAAKGWTE